MSKVTFTNSGDEEIVNEEKSLKDVTKEKGWPIAYGCEDGVCGTCLIEIEEGDNNLGPITEQEAQTLEMMSMNDGNHRLACQCKIKGDVKFKGM